MKPLPQHELRLTHPRLDLHVDVTITKRYGNYIVVAALEDDRWGTGQADTPQEAVRSALESFDEPVMSEMVESATQMAERLPSLEDSAGPPYEETGILYHVTTEEAARSILRDGFTDGRGTYMTTREHTGVWLSDRPLDINEGAYGDAILEVEIPPEAVLDYEWVEEGKPYREFLVPARVVNAYSVRPVSDDE